VHLRCTPLTSIRLAKCREVREITGQKRSWNPLKRAAAAREEAGLHVTRQSRFEAAVTEAMRDFKTRDAPEIAQRLADDERRYRRWATDSLDLEDQMHGARTLLRSAIPRVEQRLTVPERAGTSQVELHGDTSRSGFSELAVAVDRRYSALSEMLRREAERSIRREQRGRDRSRDLSIDR
jgi:hypothetical protein